MLQEWQKKTNERCRRYLKEIDENPEKFGTTKEHIAQVKKKIREIEEKNEKEKKRRKENGNGDEASGEGDDD